MLLIGAAADGAFMIIEVCLLLFADAGRLPAEVDSVGAGTARHGALEIVKAEDKEVNYGHHRQKVCREGCGKDAYNKERRIHIGQILYLYGDKIEKKHLHIREEGGKGKEKGEIDILGAEIEAEAGYEVHDKAIEHCKYDAGEKIDIEAGSAPIAFKSGADHIIEIKGDESKYPGAGRIEHEGDKAPDLPAQDKGGVEGEIAHEHGVHRTKDPEHHVGNGDIFHQIGNTEVGMLPAESVNGISHRSITPVKAFLSYD